MKTEKERVKRVGTVVWGGMVRRWAKVAPGKVAAAAKEALLAAIETGVWAMPDETFDAFDPERATERADVAALLNRCVDDASKIQRA